MKEMEKMEKMSSVYNQIISGIKFLTFTEKDEEGNDKEVVLSVKLPTMAQQISVDRFCTERIFELVKEGATPERKMKQLLQEKEIWTDKDDEEIEKLGAELQNILVDMERVKKNCGIEDLDKFFLNSAEEIEKTKKGSVARANRESLRDLLLELNKKSTQASELKRRKDLYFAGTAESQAELERDIHLICKTVYDQDDNLYFTIESISERNIYEILAIRDLWVQVVRGIRKR